MYRLPYPFAYAFALSGDALPDPDEDHEYPQISRHQTELRLTHANGVETHDADTPATMNVEILIAREA
jgi:hypothetical protein